MEDGDAVYLVRELENPFSRNAVKVCRADGPMIGYMPEVDACVLAPYLDAGCRYRARVKRVLRRGGVPIPVIIALVYNADSGVENTRGAADRPPVPAAPPTRTFPPLPASAWLQGDPSGTRRTVIGRVLDFFLGRN